MESPAVPDGSNHMPLAHLTSALPCLPAMHPCHPAHRRSSTMCWTLTSRVLQRIMPSFNGSSRTWNADWLLSSSRQDLVLAVCHAKSRFVAFCHNGKLAWSVSAAGFVSSAQMLDVLQGFDECTNVGAPSSFWKALMTLWSAMQSMPTWSASMQSLFATSCLSCKRLVDYWLGDKCGSKLVGTTS